MISDKLEFYKIAGLKPQPTFEIIGFFMSTKLLFFFAFLMIVTAAYFYASNNASLSKLSLKPSDIDYQASNIKALQTADDGMVNYRLTAKGVTHYQVARSAILDEAKVTWQTDPTRQVNLTAKQALLDETRQIVTFKDTINVQSQDLQSGSNTPNMNLKATNLVGNLTTKQLVTNEPVTVTQPVLNADGTSTGENSFTANSMQADLATGDYNFERVAMTFMPVK